MQVVSENYKRLRALSSTLAELKILIDGDTYDETRIVSRIGGRDVRPTVSGSLFSGNTVGAGGVAARTLQFCLLGSIASYGKMAMCEPFVRLVGADGTTSEWIQSGRFFIDVRRYDPATGTTSVTAYDALMMLEQSALETLDSGPWPRSAEDVVTNIRLLTRANLQLDSRTTLNASYMITEPEDRNVTLRQMLGWIGAMHGGNWIITNPGKLRLITLDQAARSGHAVLLAEPGRPLLFGDTRLRIADDEAEGDGEDYIALGKNVQSLSVGATFPRFTGVQMMYRGENTYFSGNKTGYVMEIECPYANQSIADYVLTIVGDKYYQPYSAEGALLDPASELGDAVTIDGYTSLIAVSTATFGALYSASISAPGDEEVEREFPRFKTISGGATKTDIETAINVYNDEIVDVELDEINTDIVDINTDIGSIFTAIGGLICAELDFSHWGEGYFTETDEAGTIYRHNLTFEGGTVTEIYDDDDHRMEIIW